MCQNFNRQGTHCSQCISGYGPAVFSDSITCADCSKHKHLWILNLAFQLTMLTVMCLAFMIFQIKGTSSPLNIIIAYTQIVAFQYGLSTVDYFGQKAGTVLITVLEIWNLDYFRLLPIHYALAHHLKQSTVFSSNILSPSIRSFLLVSYTFVLISRY